MDNSNEQITLKAPAKINLALSVGAPVLSGEKKGYHPIVSWMAALDFCDKVTVKKSNNNLPTFKIDFDNSAPIKQKIDWPVEKDLAYKAHKLIEKKAGKFLPIEVAIKKNIPAGMGLAGGSADGAAILLAVNKLYKLNLSDSQLIDCATRLGCDVAFSLMAMRGKPQQIATGFGEKLEVVDKQDRNRRFYIALILPPFSCATADVYREFDKEKNINKQADIAQIKKLALNTQLKSEQLFNSLATPAMRVQPKLGQAFKKIGEIVDLPVHVTGSGAGMFILVNSAKKAQEISNTINERMGLTALATRVY